MNVELLYFRGCPGSEKALNALEKALHAEGLEAEVVETVVEDDRQAREIAGFSGSPTVLIDGRDPFHDGGAKPETLACRVYPTSEGFSDHPTPNMLREALRG